MDYTFYPYRVTSLRSLALAHNDIQLWCAGLDISDRAVERLYRLLAPDEQERAGRFHFARHRRRFIASRGLMRKLLAAYTGRSADAIEFSYGPQGKPALIDAAVQFNLSHSEELALAAFTRSEALGIDVEHVREIQDARQIAERFFSQSEREALNHISEADRSQAFLYCWTRKEAFIKALGGGLSIALDSFAVTLHPSEPVRFINIDGDETAAEQWSLYHLEPAPGYVGALAVQGHSWRIQCFSLDIETLI